MQIPVIGDIIHVTLPGNRRAAAIICGGNLLKGVINIHLFHDGGETQYYSGVKYSEKPAPGTWGWPEKPRLSPSSDFGVTKEPTKELKNNERAKVSVVDCHRHLGGCISPEFVWQYIQDTDSTYLGESLEEVRLAMTFQPGEQPGFHRFLDKFRILDEIKWTPELIDKSIMQVCRDLDVDYTWLRFSINKYMKIGWHKKEAIQFVSDSFQKHAPNKVGLMLSLKYESTRASQRQYAALIDDPDIASRLVGLDLVGDEAAFDFDFYLPIVTNWINYGKIVCAHVGESQPALNVMRALDMGIVDICHGVRIITDPGSKMMIARAKDKGVTFHLAVTSNYLAGIIPHGSIHPAVAMFNCGLAITIGTDDPIQCNTTLAKEFAKLEAHMSADTIRIIKNTAAARANISQ